MSNGSSPDLQNADRRQGRGPREAWTAHAGPIGMFTAAGSGRLLRFDPVFAQLLRLPMRPIARRPLRVPDLLGPAGGRALEQATVDGFGQADCKLADGRTLLLRARRSPDGLRGWLEDVSASRRCASRLQFAACHDALTGLVNRRGVYPVLTDIIAETHRVPATVVFIDLDGFKQVNDVFGHAAGDSVLRQFATRVRQVLEPRHIAARTGGDEFVVALRGHRLHQADDWIRTLRQRVSARPFRHHEHEFMVRFSAGRIPLQPAMTPSLAINAADRDCARVKTGDPIQPPLSKASLLSLDGAALDAGLRLAAQPIHAARDRSAPIGSEWLLRLRDCTGMLRLPAEFLPSAREQGLASRIDLWVLARALVWLSTARPGASGDRAPFCNVKLSIESLHDQRFQREALELLDRNSTAAAGLRFELSGRLALQGAGAITAFVDQARTRGTRVVLSGLTQRPVWMPELSRLRPVAIKVEASWFCNRRDPETARTGVRGLIDACHELEIEACAARIESERALDAARRYGFDQVQGFLFGPPEPVRFDAVDRLPSSFRNST